MDVDGRPHLNHWFLLEYCKKNNMLWSMSCILNFGSTVQKRMETGKRLQIWLMTVDGHEFTIFIVRSPFFRSTVWSVWWKNLKWWSSSTRIRNIMKPLRHVPRLPQVVRFSPNKPGQNDKTIHQHLGTYWIYPHPFSNFPAPRLWRQPWKRPTDPGNPFDGGSSPYWTIIPRDGPPGNGTKSRFSIGIAVTYACLFDDDDVVFHCYSTCFELFVRGLSPRPWGRHLGHFILV